MTSRRRHSYQTVVVAVALCLAASASGRTADPVLQDSAQVDPRRPSGPQRDVPSPEATGTAVIRGRIVAADTGAPLRRATVRVNAPGFRGRRATTTNADGAYEVGALPPARYTVSASKPGYLSLSYGQRQAKGPSTPVDLAEGQTSDHIDFSLPRGGVIVGRVVDELGEPVMDAIVIAFAEASVGGTRRLSSAGRQALTNDLGQFRLFGLRPGDYYVVAMLRPSGGMEYPDGQGYAPSFFPNVNSASQAQRVRVAISHEQAGIDIQMTPVKVAAIAGVVLDSLGQPLTAGMVLLRPSGLDLRIPMFQGLGGRVDPSGAFTVQNVPSGDYLLVVNSSPRLGGGRIGRDRRRPGVGADGPWGAEAEIAAVPVTVAGRDISGLTVVTSRGGKASGRIVATGDDAPDLEVGSVRVSASAGDLEDGFLNRGGTSPVQPDWTFELSGLRGPLRLRVTGLPDGWGLKSVLYGQADISDTGLAFEGPGEARDLKIVITNRLTKLQGTVSDALGEPAKGFSYVLFADDSDKWTAPSRYVLAGSGGSDGRFTATGLPPGDYYVVALESFGEFDPQDPEVLERLSQSATRVALTEDDPRSVALTVVTVPEP